MIFKKASQVRADGIFSPQACGMSISIACPMSRPLKVKSSRALSKQAESLPGLINDGQNFLKVFTQDSGF